MTNNWPTKKLGEVCEIISPGVEKFDGIKKYVATADVDFDKIINFTEITYSNRPSRANVEAKKNDVLVARMAETKKFLIVNKELQENYIFSTGFVALRVKRELLTPEYLFYFLTTKEFNSQKNRLATGATQKAVNNSRLRKIKILLPPLPIQQKIVARLDAIKKAQELNDKQISLVDELFQSLLCQELKPKKSWEIKRIKDVSESVTYGISISVVANLDPENGVPIVTMADITGDNQIDFKKVRKIKLSKEKIGKFKLVNGDLLFNWRNASKKLIGKTSIFEGETTAVNASFLLKVKCNELIYNYFLYFYLNYLREIGYFERRCKFAANNTINASELKLIKIPLPSLKTQRQIVKKLSAVQEYKKKLLKQKEFLQELFESTLDKVMKGEL